MYLLYFLTYPVGLGAGKASLALLSGQLADGIATNVVGLLIDRTDTRIGKKKPWYIFGFLLVVPSFLMTFNTCLLCEAACGHNNEGCSSDTLIALQYVYFLTLPAVFNIGWAAVQISTMSAVVSLTMSNGRRDRLVSLRNGFTYFANLFTLIVAIIFIVTIDDSITIFRLLAGTLTFIGIFLSIFYIAAIPEVRLTKEAIAYDKAYKKINGGKVDVEIEEKTDSFSSSSQKVNTWKDWL
jgi:Na+/melibiose symporter-like transporter